MPGHLARATGTSRSYVSNILAYKVNPGRSFVDGIADASDLPYEEVYQRAEMLPGYTFAFAEDGDYLQTVYCQLSGRPEAARQDGEDLLDMQLEQEFEQNLAGEIDKIDPTDGRVQIIAQNEKPPYLGV